MNSVIIPQSNQGTLVRNSLHISEDGHFQLCKDRGLKLDWFWENCFTADIKTATEELGYAAKSGGIMFRGSNGQTQFRPDTPWASRGGSSPKYRTARGNYDALVLWHPTDDGYWEPDSLKEKCLRVSDHPCIVLTEGVFKAIAGCGNSIPTVSLLGVEMGLTSAKRDEKGKRYLVPSLQKYAEAGFGFIIAFDADAKTNKDVRKAERTLALALEEHNVPVYTVTGHWSVEDGKGMDDFIQNKSIEEFRKILERAVPVFDKEELSGGANKTKAPIPREVAAEIAEQYGSIWKYDNGQKLWRIWNGKIWEEAENKEFRSLVQRTLDAKEIKYKGSAFISDVLSLLEDYLRLNVWQSWDRTRYINFSDAVLDGKEGEKLEQSPGMGFTSHLPYSYKPLEGDSSDLLEVLSNNCPRIFSWMNSTMKGDSSKVLKLLAIVNGMLKFRFFDLQMFVHLMGRPGTGKGTFIRLLEKVVGENSSHSLNELAQLKDGSTVAKSIGQQLLAVPDERSASSIGLILSWTGGDKVGYREIYKGAASAHFKGLLVIGSNDPIFVGNTTGLDRRLCLVHFDNPVPDEARDSSIEEEMNGEISQLIAVALLMSDSAVTECLRGKGRGEIADFRLKEWEVKVKTNSVAAFFDEYLIVDPDASIPSMEAFNEYKTYCGDSGHKPVANNQFYDRLEMLCSDLRLNVKREFDPAIRKKLFTGLRLRLRQDDIPSQTEILTEAYRGLTEGQQRLKPAQNSGYRGLQRVEDIKDFEIESETKEVPISLTELTETEEIKEVALNPLQPSVPSVVQGFDPLHDPLSTLCKADDVLDEGEQLSEPPSDFSQQAEELRQCLADGNQSAARELTHQCKKSNTNEKVRALLTEDESERLRELINSGFIKGMQVRYVGSKFSCQYRDRTLTVDEIKTEKSEVKGSAIQFKCTSTIACRLPDGNFTTWLKPEELEKI